MRRSSNGSPILAPADVGPPGLVDGPAGVASIGRLLAPASVAVIGASRTPGGIGASILANLTRSGFTGRLVAVHPSASEVQGVAAWPSVDLVPGPIDLAVVAVPAAVVPGVVEQCIAKGVAGLVVITAGFRETGQAGRAREVALVQRVREAGVRMIGPNCMGVINTDTTVRLNATFAPAFPPTGRVAFLTQSGALGLAILQYAERMRLGLSTFVSVGNAADISSNDLLAYWAEDPATSVVLLYLESVGNPRTFARLAAALSPRKPIVLVKAGRSRAGARAAASHTGALANSDAVVDAMCRQTGVIRVDSLEELFATATLLSTQPVPRGPKVAVLTNAGGPGIMAADAIEAEGLQMAALAPATVRALRQLCPPEASVGNPVDLLAAAPPERYAAALRMLLDDPGTDAVLVVYTPPLVTTAADVARAIRGAAVEHAGGKTVAATFVEAEGQSAHLAPVPVFAFPESAVAALAHAVAYAAWTATPHPAPACPDGCDVEAARAVVAGALDARGDGWLQPAEVAAVLAALGVPLVATRTVDSQALDDVVADLGGPVVLKAVGPGVVHKTELGAVALDLRSAAEVRTAYDDMTARLGPAMTGAVVQPYVPADVELLIGATVDASFGPIVSCGLGGTTVEAVRDVGVRLAPVTPGDVEDLLARLRGATVLGPFRGRPAVNRAAVIDAVCRVSWLVTSCPEVRELDLNPVAASGSGVQVLDARVRVERVAAGPSPRRRG